MGRHIEVDVPQGVTLIGCDFAVLKHSVIQDGQATGILVMDHSCEFRLGYHVILE